MAVFYGFGFWLYGNLKTGIYVTLPINFPQWSYKLFWIKILSEAVSFYVQIINISLRGNFNM